MRAQRVPSGLLLGLASVSAVSALHEQGARHHHVARSASATLSAPPMNTAVVNGVTRGIKAGLSGYLGVQSQAAFQQIAPHISWYSDYQANTTDVGDVAGVGMVRSPLSLRQCSSTSLRAGSTRWNKSHQPQSANTPSSSGATTPPAAASAKAASPPSTKTSFRTRPKSCSASTSPTANARTHPP